MATLKPPSIQHLCRVWHPRPSVVARRLIRMVKGGPTFNYGILREAAFEHLFLHQPIAAIAPRITSCVRDRLVDDFLSVLPLMDMYFTKVGPEFVVEFAVRHYSIAADLRIPFNPPLLYGKEGKLHLPWFSFWRSSPLRAERLSLFVTLARETLAPDRDLKDVAIEMLDFSSDSTGGPRTLKIVNCDQVPLLLGAKRDEMLGTFAAGYRFAQKELRGVRADVSLPTRVRQESWQQSLFADSAW